MRKDSELAIQEQAEKLRTTLDVSISSILYMRAIRAPESNDIIDFLIELAKQSIRQSTRLTPEQVTGRRLLELFPGNIDNGFFAAYVRVVEIAHPERLVSAYRDELGLEGWFDMSAVRQGDDGVVVTFMNVTESKHIEQQLRESNASLEQFAAIASHDLQEPLRKIILFGDMLLREYGPLLGRGLDLVERMKEAADRMRTLIRGVLALSKLSQVEPDAHQPLDLNRVMSQVLLDLELSVQEKQALVKIDPLPTLTGDALQLQQLLQNLLSNALKFSKPDQSPVVHMTSVKKSWPELPADLNLHYQSYWQITLTDNGIGFGETYREKIFGVFERLHGRSSPYSGTGIGLAIVRKVMDNHHGVITAHSREGEGATFQLYFPVKD